jgi:glycyl-tRNA synthetase
VHAKATGTDLTAQETFETPKSIEVTKWDIKNAVLGKALGKKSKEVTEHVRALKLADALALEKELAEKGEATVKVLIKGDATKGESSKEESFVLKRDMMSVSTKTEMVHTAKYTPNVIEPAFGIGRIFYSILEHTYYVRPPKPAAEKKAESKEDAEDAAARRVFALPAHIAPTKLSILPISNREEFEPIQKELARAAVQANVTYKIDASAGSIGKRYAKADEIGIPFGITSQYSRRQRCVCAWRSFWAEI